MKPVRAAARAAALAMALTGRANAAAGRPFDLWTPQLSLAELRAAAGRLARGEAEALWAAKGRPEEGLLLYAPSPRESAVFGYGCARLAGPYLKPDRQELREEQARRLGLAAAALAGTRGDRLLILKTGQDPAALRGLTAAGFVLAEMTTCLELRLPRPAPVPTPLPAGLIFRPSRPEAAEETAEETAEALGDFFYDGHLRHGVRPGAEAAGRLWRLTLIEELKGAADEIVLLWDEKLNRAAGLASARLNGPPAVLSILALAEAYRGRGLGRSLLAALIGRLGGRAAALRAETAAWNRPALTLYLNAGFKPRAPLAALHLYG